MAGNCLHCRIHEAIQAHAQETYRPRLDGRQPIDAPTVVRDLGAVAAEVIAGGQDSEAVSAALGFFMASFISHLARHGVNATMSLTEPAGEPPARLQ